MKERGLIFSAPMIKALLAGRKTQTRRLMKPQGSRMEREILPDGVTVGWRTNVSHKHGPTTILTSPYGAAGDRLWCRETFRFDFTHNDRKPRDVESGSAVAFEADRDWDRPAFLPGKCRQSIFLPRWASRITLEVIEVRVERLQDISEKDARAEGLSCLSKDGGQTWKWGIPDRDGWPGKDDDGWQWQDWNVAARIAYARLWEQINGAGSWEANPWVWALSFRRIAQ